jgi:NhaP-type Na+/H+ or K+/H+ antiporter
VLKAVVSPEVAWFLLAGAVFLSIALTSTVLRRLPLSAAMVYLALGYGLSRAGFLEIDPVAHAAPVERITEVAVLVSLFTAGLKLRSALTDVRWRAPLRLATLSMILTVGAVAYLGVAALALPLGAAVLLGAILAPTDPVLASEVQVTHPSDRDRLRFALTGEAGLNDGTAFPFVMLGLGLLGLHELGEGGWRWFAVDVAWAVGVGLGLGAALGSGLGLLVLYLRRHHEEAVGLDDFLALGLVATVYGAALLMHAYGFLAVFAAGLALRNLEQRSGGPPPDEALQAAARLGSADEIATDPDAAPAYMAQAVLGFNEQLERLFEVIVVVMIGSMLPTVTVRAEIVGVTLALLLVVRPLATTLGLLGSDVTASRRRYVAWFGIRGVGSMYYLSYAVAHGLSDDLARALADATLTVVATSIVAHGASVTPLMAIYSRSTAPAR